MGAWGEGPLDNDDAMDLVYELEEDRKTGPCGHYPSKESFVSSNLSYFSKGPADLTVSGTEDWATTVMAYAAWFHKNGYDISPFFGIISQAIDIATINATSEELGWNSPNDRIEAMSKFRKQIFGNTFKEKKYKFRDEDGMLCFFSIVQSPNPKNNKIGYKSILRHMGGIEKPQIWHEKLEDAEQELFNRLEDIFQTRIDTAAKIEKLAKKNMNQLKREGLDYFQAQL